VPKPRAVGLLPVCPTVKPVGEPDALIGHARFDERGCETERCRTAEATALILDSTEGDMAIGINIPRKRPPSGLIPAARSLDERNSCLERTEAGSQSD
jgi:hypothetical protein